MTAQQFVERRKALGLFQAQLAEKLGLTVRTIRRYERGEAKIPVAVATAMRALRSRRTQPSE